MSEELKKSLDDLHGKVDGIAEAQKSHDTDVKGEFQSVHHRMQREIDDRMGILSWFAKQFQQIRADIISLFRNKP